MAILSTMVAAMLLSRAVNDKRLSKRILQAAAESVLFIPVAMRQPKAELQA
jgi:TetR/AcrR family transcriptional repressor of nem operon